MPDSQRMWRAVSQLAGSFLLVLLFSAGAGASSSTGGCSWRDLTPSGFRGDTYLYDAAVVSSSEAWAVEEDEQTALILHWDGRAWRRVAAVPEVDLTALAVVSSDDVWAVGQKSDFSRPVTMHWNGVRWRRVSAPRDPGGNNFLSDVVALAPNDVWAVGHVYDSRRPLAEHWNGRKWSTVPMPPGVSSLSAIDGNSGRDLWAVGINRVPKGAALHWIGKRWISAPLPDARFPDSYLDDVAVVSASLAWAVGSSNTRSDHPDRDPNYKWAHYTLRWNGARWTPDPAADQFLGSKRVFEQIVAAPHGSVWALVSDDALVRRDAHAWKPISRVPFAAKPDAEITDLEPISDHSLLLTGTYWNGEHKHTSPVIARAVCRD